MKKFYHFTLALMLLCASSGISVLHAQAGDDPITEFTVPRKNGGPGSIVSGPDNALYFTNGTEIERIAIDGTVSAYPLPLPNVWPLNITRGADNALWFTAPSTDKIGRMTTTGTFSFFDIPT